MYGDWFSGKGTLSEDAITLEVCRYMSWDYHTYLNQPINFIRLVIARMQGEASAQKTINNH